MKTIDAVFTAQSTPVIPALAILRDQVLELNQQRRPKWRFRLAPDLIVQIQPANKQARRLPRDHWDEVHALNKSNISGQDRLLRIEVLRIEDTLIFESVAIVGPEDVTSFDKKPNGNPAPWVWLKFGIYADASGAWSFELLGWTAKRGVPVDGAVDRVRAALTAEQFAFFTPNMMLSPHCLFCGKKLSDPASLARWIGPECGGTTSLGVPRIFLTAFENESGGVA